METVAALKDPQALTELPRELRLSLVVRDPEVITELSKHEEGTPREQFALSALRLGILALRQASGAIDAAAVRNEGDRLLGSVRELLVESATRTLGGMTTTLKQYFDPTDGALHQRLERLTKKDGEIEALLARHLDGDMCTVAQTLAKHVGEQSPLLKLLSPDQSDGVVAALAAVIETALNNQREVVLRQFSLDDKESALCRLVEEISGANGELREALSKDVATVRNEFSLDNEQGALSRLVSRVEKAQQTIADQLSRDNEDSALCKMTKLIEATNAKVEASLTLDQEASPLSRLRRELLLLLESFSQKNSQFQSDVRATLEAMQARKQEQNLSPRHGDAFEEAVGVVIQAEAQRLGDVFEATGRITGVTPNCKVGDHVIELGPESAAPGAKVVFEAKEEKKYTVAKAKEEVAIARQNRQAQVGIFVFSKATAPAGIEPLARFGSDILVVWDPDDLGTDIFLKAAFTIARALVVRERVAGKREKRDFDAFDKAVARISKDAAGLAEIATWATTIKNDGQKILDKVNGAREDLEKQVEFLKDLAASMRKAEEGESA